MRRWLISFVFLGLSLAGSVSAETEPVSFPEIPELARSTEWRRMLFYGRNALGLSRGVMDQPGFYLSPAGKTDPEAELRAFLVALRAPVAPQDPDSHAACRFPARSAWVRQHLPRLTFEKPSCPLWEQFQASHVYRGASLVFSSYYVEHPSSLFGHTFLALHKQDNPAPLLDDALNYGAVPTTNNPFLYAWLGLVGGFPGTFQIIPYYAKVQEYAHSEHRDLWSYRLALSPADMAKLTQVIWDVGGTSADYYFFDENCSALMLYLLATVAPQLTPPEGDFWVIPSDAIRTLVKSGLVADVHGTASSLERFLARHDKLTPADEEIFRQWVREKPVPLPDPEREARLLDTYLDYMDYREKVAANWDAGAWEKPRQELLKRRATLKVRMRETVAEPPARFAPHLGHDSFRFGLALGGDEQGSFASLRLRTALHDLLNQPEGYHEGLAVEVSSTRVDIRPSGHVSLRSYELVKVFSLPRLPSMIRPFAWDFSFGWRRRQEQGETFLRYALGWNIPVRDTWDFFVLGRAEIGASRRAPFLAGAPLLGVRVRASSAFTFLATGARQHLWVRDAAYQWANQGTLAASWAVNEQWDLRLEGTKDGAESEAVLAVYHTF